MHHDCHGNLQKILSMFLLEMNEGIMQSQLLMITMHVASSQQANRTDNSKKGLRICTGIPSRSSGHICLSISYLLEILGRPKTSRACLVTEANEIYQHPINLFLALSSKGYFSKKRSMWHTFSGLTGIALLVHNRAKGLLPLTIL